LQKTLKHQRTARGDLSQKIQPDYKGKQQEAKKNWPQTSCPFVHEITNNLVVSVEALVLEFDNSHRLAIALHRIRQ
jgi:hypothetical protein